MDIFAVQKIIDKIADGFTQACVACMHDNEFQFKQAVQEQLFSGLDGKGNYLDPDYDSDPYFQRVRWFRKDDDGTIYHGAEGYKQWKLKITPPEPSTLIGLPARRANIPNLYIDGTFYNTMMTSRTPEGVIVDNQEETGRKIEDKYGKQIFNLTEDAVGWFNREFMIPAIRNFFSNCGYR